MADTPVRLILRAKLFFKVICYFLYVTNALLIVLSAFFSVHYLIFRNPKRSTIGLRFVFWQLDRKGKNKNVLLHRSRFISIDKKNNHRLFILHTNERISAPCTSSLRSLPVPAGKGDHHGQFIAILCALVSPCLCASVQTIALIELLIVNQ